MTQRREERGLRLARFLSALAHLSLGSACLAIALDPAAVAGFHYHPRMVAVVHLVTLGWLTGSLMACLLAAVPAKAQRLAGPGKTEWVSLCLYALAFSGVVSHFWIGEASGVGLSGMVTLLVLLRLGLWALLRGPRAPGAEWALPFCNLVLAVSLGVAMVLDRYWEVLPGRTLDQVHAHGHLAALGWVAMGMHTLRGDWQKGPAAMLWLWQGACVALALAFLLPTLPGKVLVVASGLALAWVGWRIRDSWLLLSIALGVALGATSLAEAEPRLLIAYGTLALLGYLGQGLLAPQHLLLGPGAKDTSSNLSTLWAGAVGTMALAFTWSWLPGLVIGALGLLWATGISARQLFAVGIAQDPVEPSPSPSPSSESP